MDNTGKTHVIKIERKFVGDILSGRKKAEIRYNDRLYQTGDILSFWIVATADALASNWVVLSIERI